MVCFCCNGSGINSASGSESSPNFYCIPCGGTGEVADFDGEVEIIDPDDDEFLSREVRDSFPDDFLVDPDSI